VSEIIDAALMGLVEGLTEFIPVSSTGHLILFGDLISFERDPTFKIVIQFGAILSVVFLYWKRFLSLISTSTTTGLSGIRGMYLLAIGCAPAMICGVLFHKTITEVLFHPIPVAMALIVGGFMMLVLERKVEPKVFEVDEIKPRHALLVGLVQCLALWPGMSRSGSSIVGGLLSGLSKKVSAEFSFILAVPMMTAASAYQLFKTWNQLSSADLSVYLVGLATSFVTALLAIKVFLSILSRYSFAPFAWYRIGLGIIVLILLR